MYENFYGYNMNSPIIQNMYQSGQGPAPIHVNNPAVAEQLQNRYAGNYTQPVYYQQPMQQPYPQYGYNPNQYVNYGYQQPFPQQQGYVNTPQPMYQQQSQQAIPQYMDHYSKVPEISDNEFDKIPGSMVDFKNGFENPVQRRSVFQNYYNPYMVNNMNLQKREEMRRQKDIWIALGKKVAKASGEEFDSTPIDTRFDMQTEAPKYKSEKEWKLARMRENGLRIAASCEYYEKNNIPMPTIGYQEQQELFRKMNRMREFTGEDFTLKEFFHDIYGKLKFVYSQMELKQARNDMSIYYNQDQFHKEIDKKVKEMGDPDTIFNRLMGYREGEYKIGQRNPNTGITYGKDSMEITLPDHLKNAYDQRREAFLGSIMNKWS